MSASAALAPPAPQAATRPAEARRLASIELFAGGGGLVLGTEQSGFSHLVMNEYDGRACETLRLNGANDLAGTEAVERPLIEGDCRAVDWQPWRGEVDLLAGGPPCQPFSIGGVHRGDEDHRNLFPEAIRALATTRPRAFLFENVRGLTRKSFRPYLDYILDWLAVPHLVPKDDESWPEHHARLLRDGGLEAASDCYSVAWKLVNAADYGVPQQRWRIVIVGFRANLDIDWTFPSETHSRAALLSAQRDGSYWSEHGIEPPAGCVDSNAPLSLQGLGGPKRWRTLRDALVGLPEPVDGAPHPDFANHEGVPGARLYQGHSGSALDWPAKSVKAGVHGCPGGEHILVRPDGSYRYWTVRETARVQGFPDDHHFAGPRSEAMRQIGNAVPPPLARVMATAIAETLADTVHGVANHE